jgi:hypothetical protein
MITTVSRRRTWAATAPACMVCLVSMAPLPAAVAAGPVDPFAGDLLAAWKTTAGGPVTGGWDVAGGVVHLVPAAKPPGGGPRPNYTIVTADEFGDFTLSFDWKIAAGGNSGIKYRVRSFGPRQLGCEYQLLDDDAHTGRISPRQRTASLYGLYEPAGDVRPHPPGEWNSARIVVRGDTIEHWLNGRQTVAATVGDADWNRRLAESKFEDRDGFGSNPRGRLMLTDHGSEVWFRNFVFQPADGAAPLRAP